MKSKKLLSKHFLKTQEYLFFSRRKLIAHYHQIMMIQLIKKRRPVDFDLYYGKFSSWQSSKSNLEKLYNPIWVSEI